MIELMESLRWPFAIGLMVGALLAIFMFIKQIRRK